MTRVQLRELDPGEREVLRRGLALAQQATGQDVGAMTSIVTFRDPGLRGLHKSGELLVRREELTSLGTFLVTVLHEYAHEFGGDGGKPHVDALQQFLEQVITTMEQENADAR